MFPSIALTLLFSAQVGDATSADATPAAEPTADAEPESAEPESAEPAEVVESPAPAADVAEEPRM